MPALADARAHSSADERATQSQSPTVIGTGPKTTAPRIWAVVDVERTTTNLGSIASCTTSNQVGGTAMRARYLFLVAVVVAGLFGAMAIRSAQGQAGRTLTFR